MIAIIVSGSPHSWIDLEEFKNPDALIIGVDRGALMLLENGIVPVVAIGDFDSVSETEFNYLSKKCNKVIKLSCEKDETDTEVAILHAISLGFSEIYIYGGLGGRIDHMLANIRLLLRFVKEGISISLINDTHHIRVLSPDCYQFEPFKYSYLSFFAIEEDVSNLTLTGVKYPLTDYLLRQDDVRCISNEVISDKFGVSFSHGYLLMINSQD